MTSKWISWTDARRERWRHYHFMPHIVTLRVTNSKLRQKFKSRIDT